MIIIRLIIRKTGILYNRQSYTLYVGNSAVSQHILYN